MDNGLEFGIADLSSNFSRVRKIYLRAAIVGKGMNLTFLLPATWQICMT